MRRCRGFSAAELLLVVGILAVLAVIAMPAFSALMQTYRLNSATSELASQLRYAQSLAVSNGTSYRLHSGSDPIVNLGNTYRIERTPYANADAITSWRNIDASYPGVRLSSIMDNTNATLYWVEFNARGNTVPPNPPFTLTVSPPIGTGIPRAIQVRRTGSVRIQP